MLKPGVHRMKTCDHDDGQAYVFICTMETAEGETYEQWNCKMCGHAERIKNV